MFIVTSSGFRTLCLCYHTKIPCLSALLLGAAQLLFTSDALQIIRGLLELACLHLGPSLFLDFIIVTPSLCLQTFFSLYNHQHFALQLLITVAVCRVNHAH